MDTLTNLTTARHIDPSEYNHTKLPLSSQIATRDPSKQQPKRFSVPPGTKLQKPDVSIKQIEKLCVQKNKISSQVSSQRKTVREKQKQEKFLSNYC